MSCEVKFLFDFLQTNRFVVKPSNREQILRYPLVSITVPVGQLKTTILTQYTIIKKSDASGT